MEGNLPFLPCFTLYLRAISKYKPPGGLYLEGRFNGGGCVTSLGGFYLEGLIFGILRYFNKFCSLICTLSTISSFLAG